MKSNLNNFGVRKYESFSGRFISIDPLWEKYYSWSPYHYSGNNPVIAKDGSGKWVKAYSKSAKQIIYDVLPTESWQYIKFDENGFINRDLINSINFKSCNFKNLKMLVNNNITFVLHITDQIQFKDKIGSFQEIEFSNIRINHNWDPGVYTLSTKELGWLGETLFPGNSDLRNSINNDVNIFINKYLSSEGKAETASHELLGHAFIFSLGLNPYHIFLMGGIEGNVLLKTQIIQSMTETKYNMLRRE